MDTEMDTRLRAEMFPPTDDDYEWGGEDLKPLMQAMAEVQWALRVHLDGQVSAGNRGYRYATLPSMWAVLRPLLQDQRLLVQQLDITPRDSRGTHVRLLTQVTHVDSLASCKFRTWTTQHAARVMNSTQVEGSTLTYAKKRALMGVFGIAPEDLDANEEVADAHYDDDPWNEFVLVMDGAGMSASVFGSYVTGKYGQSPVRWDRARLKRAFANLSKGQWDTVLQWQAEGEE